MTLEAWRWGHITAEGEKPAMVALASEAAELFAATCAAERRALYVVSANAGFASSIAFWAGAVREGVALAGPGLFPWTLSNAPCGWLAREFGIRGPNVTHTGRIPALGAALHQCWLDLDERQADVGWVVAVDFASRPNRAASYAAMRLTQASGGARVDRSPTREATPPLRASAALARVLADAARGGCGAFSDGHTAWLVTIPPTSRSARRERSIPPSRL